MLDRSITHVADIFLQVYAFNFICILIGPERHGRTTRIEVDDETVGVVGQKLVDDVLGGEDERPVETIEEKTTVHTVEPTNAV